MILGHAAGSECSNSGNLFSSLMYLSSKNLCFSLLFLVFGVLTVTSLQVTLEQIQSQSKQVKKTQQTAT